jgi:hypothetical protein
MNWSVAITELIPALKKYKKLCASLLLSFSVFLYFINNPQKTNIIAANPLIMLMIALAAMCLSAFFLDRIDQFIATPLESKNSPLVTIKDISVTVSELKSTQIPIDVVINGDPSKEEFSLESCFMLIAPRLFGTPADESDMKEALLENRTKYPRECTNITMYIVRGFPILRTEMCRLGLIENLEIPSGHSKWILTRKGELVYAALKKTQ